MAINDTKICTAGNSECLFVSGQENEIIIALFGDCQNTGKAGNVEITLSKDQTEVLILTLQRRLQENTL